MRVLAALSTSLPLILLPCCTQTRDWCTIEEVRFDGSERPEQEAALERLMAYMEDQPRAADMDAEELAEHSLLRSYVPLETLKNAEEAYLELVPEARIRLAADVMDALLSSPSRLMGGVHAGCTNREHVHSYQHLNVSSWRQDAGEFFTPGADKHDDTIRTQLFKRMVARIILEDVACNANLELDVRSAAVECLRHICRDGLLEADGAWDSAYVVDALPLHATTVGLETALFGSPAWQRQRQ